MSTINKVILIGNLGADPELRYTQAGTAVAELRLATSWKSGDKEETEWHRVILWEKLGEIASKYLAKGSKVYIEGRLKTRTYEDKDGVTRYVTEVVAQNLTMLSPKSDTAPETKEAREDEPAPKTRKPRAKRAPEPEVADEDIFA